MQYLWHIYLDWYWPYEITRYLLLRLQLYLCLESIQNFLVKTLYESLPTVSRLKEHQILTTKKEYKQIEQQ